MKAMILAAGLGTRLRPITNAMPKPLLPVAGVPLIVWNLLLLRQAGIVDVIINLHHLGHLIEKELGDGSRYGMRVCYSPEPLLLGTGGGIRQVKWFFGNEPFVVLNGDTVLDLDLGALIRELAADQQIPPGSVRGSSPGWNIPVATLVVRDDPHVEQWGVVELVGRRILRINGRGSRERLAGQTDRRMFAGVHVIDPRVLNRLPADGPASIIDAYVQALEAGEILAGYVFTGYWSDVGTSERYEQVQRDAERGLINLRSRT
jgi:NDP-sugar pyrophosphorylase family protein